MSRPAALTAAGTPRARRSTSIAPTPLGLVMIVAIQVIAFTVRGAADPLVAGMVWAFGAGVIAIGVAWPVVSGLLLRAELLATPTDATAGSDIAVELQLAGASGDLAVRWVGTGDAAWRSVSVPARGVLPVERPARGVITALTLEARTAAPVGLLRFRRTFVFELDRPIVVGPRVTAVDWQPRRAPSTEADHRPARTTARGDVVRSVRPYVTGDPAHLVHWPSSAHTGSLVVREFEPPTEVGEAVVVDLRTTSHPTTHAAVELAVERAAGLVQSILRRGGRVVLCTSDGAEPRSTPIARPLDAARQLATAAPGEPATPPSGWSAVVVRP